MRVEHYLVQRRGFWFTLFVVSELFLLALPCVSRKHIDEEILQVGAKVVWAPCIVGGEGFRGRRHGVGVSSAASVQTNAGSEQGFARYVVLFNSLSLVCIRRTRCAGPPM